MEIVSADIPALLGLYVLDHEDLVADKVFHSLSRWFSIDNIYGCKVYVDEWFIPMKRAKSYHLYVPMEISSLVQLTKTQFHKLNGLLFYLSLQNLFNFLKTFSLKDTAPETLRNLQ